MTDTDHRLEQLRRRYVNSFPAKRAALAEAWRTFCGAPDDPAAQSELSMQVHRLCGSAGAYGYPRLGECACAADRLIGDELMATAPPRGSELVWRFEACVQAVLAELAAFADSTQPSSARVDARDLRIVLVEDDPAQATLTAAELEARGCSVRVESGGDLLWQALALWPCHAVVLDYWLRAETAAEVAVALRREPQFARIALLCYSVERDPLILRAVLAAGCDAVVAKDDGADRLLEAVNEAVMRADRGATVS
jgi:CheY-like chemotaxis protein